MIQMDAVNLGVIIQVGGNHLLEHGNLKCHHKNGQSSKSDVIKLNETIISKKYNTISGPVFYYLCSVSPVFSL